MARDPIEYVDGPNLYEYVKSGPLVHTDYLGLACCDDLCSNEHAQQNVTVRGYALQNAHKPFNPSIGEDLWDAINTLHGLELIDMILEPHKWPAFPYWLWSVHATHAMHKAVDQIDEDLRRLRGVRIWVLVEGECCEKEPCWFFWERLNWKQTEWWFDCPAYGKYHKDKLEGFRVNDIAGMVAALPGCMRDAVREFRCPNGSGR